jgi:NAD(P)-dependent dehydrogenase (short-subunit alcohol dehydrogenase family)
MSTAIITGASRGLGLALARALVARGWNLVIDARGEQALRAVAEELDRQSKVEAVTGDVDDHAHLERLVTIARGLGDLSLVVNNASILGPSPQPSLATYPMDTMNDVFRVNVLAPLRLIQLALPHLTVDARIINVTSDAAIEGYEGWGGYGASKAALEQISNVLAAEHPDLRIYWVDPGDMNTQMHQEAFPGEDVSDRPAPEASVPGLLTLIEGDLPSGRYRARELVTTGADA